MSGIFISHSSKNSSEAERLRDWLEEQGWGRSQVFLDLQDLKSGDSWRDVLNAMGDKEAVIVCLSNEWLGSHECVREFTQAQERGKPILPIFVAPVTASIPRFITDLQIADATKDGFLSLRDGLLAKRITPQSFIWPPPADLARAVYRGLQPLEVQDAAIFFGRDADIARGLDDLRRLRNGAPQRLLVILGASGAGKSSFLRAGLIARLKRDEENFLVLPIVRPDRAAISGARGLAEVVSTALGRPVVLSGPADLVQAFGELRKPVMERLTRNAEAARETYAAKPPTIIIPLDQAEELFGADNAERAVFCEMVANAIVQDGNALIVATIRSDSYEALQNGLLPDRQTPFTLPAIVAGSFQEIIEGPARLAKPPLTVEPALTQQLLTDLDAADALPLLAFTLEWLHTQGGADGTLTLDDYRDKLGGLSGAIQSAVAAVLGEHPTKERLALARRLFVPALVQVDQDGVKRRIARRADLPAETQGLADQFVLKRLLVTCDGNIEVAHEAILRQWPALAAWIAEEHDALTALGSVRAAAVDWDRQAKRDASTNAPGWLLHRGERLHTAKEIVRRHDFASAVDSRTTTYLAACTKQEALEKNKRMRLRAAATTSLLTVVMFVTVWMNWNWIHPEVVRLTRFAPYVHTGAELSALQPAAEFQDCAPNSNECPTMIIVPAGEIALGERPLRAEDLGMTAEEFAVSGLLQEDTRRRFTVRPFAVSRTEVTFDHWAACVRAGGCATQPNPADRGWGRGDRPVIHVSAWDAQEYTSWLSRVTGAQYRLLDGVEWEYAARASGESGARWSFGDDARQIEGHGVFLSNSNGRSSPVGSRLANAFGLHDMAGNVWEWTRECLSDSAEDAGGSVTDGLGDLEASQSCEQRAARGGSWGTDPHRVSIATRLSESQYSRKASIGFRVARVY